MWDLGLPEGWKMLVTGCEGDPLIDRQVDLVKDTFTQGFYHGSEIIDPLKTKKFLLLVRKLISHFKGNVFVKL
uniref:Uncharacterized protein n=1 Tax=Solanum lycopersicum TaxID=4081 RepID=A0A3Q7I588_SOLLC